MTKYLEATVAAQVAEYRYPNEQQQEWMDVAIRAVPDFSGITADDVKLKLQNLFRGKLYATLLMLDECDVDPGVITDQDIIDDIVGYNVMEDWAEYDRLGEDTEYPNNQARLELALGLLYDHFTDMEEERLLDI